ncbi:hypothetical protein [Bradyrhizobium japonicum]|uniref:hypothetical protein n=1 Tax=Bradyrhizobium japonicum TaxID=375 RepID=UPI0011DCAEB5|nr:hypothetical protein [Bradyrhizobium japonicum]MCD9106065.1 hypothetical protein [Bradyrhizobium japonicum]MCD9259472.1 hypothetical protein [Bradyrhizobium japonicum SEMIA 5079]MCD9817194.1 hypothetical protein [Bradyrhizobium japonicum]MCD9890295.1 hypothetical protein [Bradyrhizobium japonicum]MCD9904802.1 hypothetical protein [Bradyrhizobium japonicum]
MTTHRTAMRWTEWVHVRNTEYAGADLGLVLHPDDDASERFLLMQLGPRTLPPLGWITGRDGKQAKYQVELPSGQHAFVVPVKSLESSHVLKMMMFGLNKGGGLTGSRFERCPYQSWANGGPPIDECNFDVNEFRAIRKVEGQKIEPDSATMICKHAPTLDPYGIDDLPARVTQSGRQYYARAPGGEMWVSFYDLPAETRSALWSRYCEEAAQSELNGSR